MEDRYVRLSDVDRMIEDCYYLYDDPTYESISNHYSDIPIADVEPVRHARWIVDYNNTYSRRKMKCSLCGKFSGIGGIESNQKKSYCPNCGAKMDEEHI